MTSLTRSLILGAAISAPLLALGAEYTQVDNRKSSIQFTYQQMGVKMDGRFRQFSGQLRFDPAKPTAAKASVDITLASIDTGGSESDEEVAGKSWFNTKVFPSARFVSTRIKPLGDNRYEVAGQLSIKGHTVDIVVPASFTSQGNAGVFEGAFTLHRGDFSIGEGSWAKYDIVANDILVKFHITANTGK